MSQNSKLRLYYEQVRRAATFRSHFIFWLPLWVIVSTLLLAICLPGTPNWRPDQFWTLWGIWSAVFIFALQESWSKFVTTEVYPDHLCLTIPDWSIDFHREDVLHYELDDTLRDNVNVNRYRFYLKAPRHYVVHVHFAKGIRLHHSKNGTNPIFIESRHPKELLAALDKMMHPDAEPR